MNDQFSHLGSAALSGRAPGMFNLNDPRWGRGDEPSGQGDPRPDDQPSRPADPPSQPSDQPRGGQGGGRSPNQGPPDLDELWRDFNRKLGGMFGGRGGGRGDGPSGGGRYTPPELKNAGAGAGATGGGGSGLELLEAGDETGTARGAGRQHPEREAQHDPSARPVATRS